jgi:hypothetical protein
MDHHLDSDGDPSSGTGVMSLTSEPSITSSNASPQTFPLPPQRAARQRHSRDNITNNIRHGDDHDSGSNTSDRPSRLRVAFARPPSFPAVIWNDRQSLSATSSNSTPTSSGQNHYPQQQQTRRQQAACAGAAANSTAAGAVDQTFYSEGTPPPSPTDFRSNLSSNGPPEYGPGYGDVSKPTPKLEPPYDYSYDHVAPPAPLPKAEGGGGIWRWLPSKRKRGFWVIVAAFLVAIGIAVGVGVGVGLKGSSGGDSDRYASDLPSFNL